MKISVQVKVNSKKESVEKKEDGSYTVRVNTPPVDGKANERLVELLAEHFQVSKRSVNLVSGFTSRKKIIEIK